MTPSDRDLGPSQQKMLGQVARKAERKLKAQGQGHRSIWFGLGMFGLVGWAVAVPTLLGIALGVWLDSRWPAGRLSWTLTFLGLGIALGCLNAWYWVQREGRHE